MCALLRAVFHGLQDFEGRQRLEFPEFSVRFSIPLLSVSLFSSDTLSAVARDFDAVLRFEEGAIEETPLFISGASASAVLNASLAVFDLLTRPPAVYVPASPFLSYLLPMYCP